MKAGFPVSLDSVNRILNMYCWRLSRVTMAPEHNHILIEITGLGSGHLFTITLLVGLHGNKMSSQSSLSLCKEHCPITLQQAHILFEVSLKPLWLVSLEGAKSANFSGMALNGLLDTGVLVIAVLLIVHPGSFFV